MLSSRLRPYQRQGAAWIATKLRQPDVRAVGLLDEPGVGKSVQALLAALILGAARMIIAAPAGARRVWTQEIARWLPQWTNRILVVEPGVVLQDHVAKLDQRQLIVVIAYDSLGLFGERNRNAWASALERRRWDLLIVDEAHYLKNLSNRTRAVYGLRGDGEGVQAACERVLLLTGTFMPNHAGEAFNHMRALWPATLVVPGAGVLTDGHKEIHAHRLTRAEFEERVTDFRDTQYGRQIIRSKNQPWLRERLAPFLLRRTKAQVLPELPPLVAQDVPLSVSHAARAGIDPLLWRRGVLLWDRTRRLGDDAFIAELNRQAATENGTGNNAIATLRRELGLLKVQPAAEWIEERLGCGMRKLLVFGWHVAVLSALCGLLREYNPVLITGATPTLHRNFLIKVFQTDPHVRVFIGQILAAGTAITLTAASEVVIVEPSWVPGENRQAIDRAYRLGQRDSVLASFLFIPATLDARIMTAFRRKAVEIAPIIEPTAEDQGQGEGTPDVVACAH